MRNIFLSVIALMAFSLAQAASIEPVKANVFLTEDGYALSAEFAIDLGPRVEETVAHGVPLYFNLELEVTRPRKYWVDEHVLSHTLTYRLSYHALTQQYRLATGTLHRSFATLADALRAMGRIAALPVAEKLTFKSGVAYQAALRLSLDRNQLPKPFQLDAIASRDWQIDANTLRWQLSIGEIK
jgi:Domain of unknown function (DUF4390)